MIRRRRNCTYRIREMTLACCALLIGMLCAGPADAAGQKSGGAPKQASQLVPSKTLSSKSKKKKRGARNRGQQAPTPDRIREIQEALGRSGYYSGDPTGKWDSSTIEGMKKFQAANGIDPTGKLDALSLQKLGLGSDVAGLSAPRQSPPPAAPTVPSPPTSKPTSPAPPKPQS